MGGGRLEGELRARAGRHPDAARVVTGVPHEAVPAYLNAMDLLAAPSQTTPIWKEQLGRMLPEGMGCGVPIMAGDSGEIPHVVADAGRVVPEPDEAAWVAALGDLLESPDLRRDLRGRGLRGRGLAHVRDVYAWPQVARQFLDFFRDLRDAAPVAPRPRRAGRSGR